MENKLNYYTDKLRRLENERIERMLATRGQGSKNAKDDEKRIKRQDRFYHEELRKSQRNDEKVRRKITGGRRFVQKKRK